MLKVRCLISALFVIISANCLASECIEVDLYVNDGAEIESDSEHPCGYVSTQCLTAIPLSHHRFESNWAYEISTNGNAINKWPLPVDAQIYAIFGSSIVVGYPNYEKHDNGWVAPSFVRIELNGSISRAPEVESSELDGIECAKFSNDETVSLKYCRKFKDSKTGSIRFLAFPMACT